MSLRGVAAWAGDHRHGRSVGSGPRSNACGPSADWLQEIVGSLLARRLEGSAAVSGGRAIRLVDGTTISERGSDRADWAAALQLRSARWADNRLPADDSARGRAPAPGEGDRPAISGWAIATSPRARDCIMWCRPVQTSSYASAGTRLSLRTASGQSFDLAKRLKRLAKAERAEWRAVGPRARRQDGCRFASLIVPQAPRGDRTRDQAHQGESRSALAAPGRSGKAPTRAASSPRTTPSSPPSLEQPAAQIFELYRLRWQIEIAFKRLKSLLHIDRLEAKDPDLIRTWLLAHIHHRRACSSKTTPPRRWTSLPPLHSATPP